ncbi:hypothetical protein LZ32DRAFT_183559 [Colletotrichum eremochloae]|nr:hypothetical protein LZ32DRAFT_183559 [Colletotrichum eremochloae]
MAWWLINITRCAYNFPMTTICSGLGNKCCCLLLLSHTFHIPDKQSYVKRWAGVETEQPFYARKDGPPHEVDLCEGCKRG